MQTTSDNTQINPLYTFHRLNQIGTNKAQRLAAEFTTFTNAIQSTVFGTGSVVGSREWSIVMTKLEEAAFFAKKVMSMQIENQDSVN